MTDVLEAAREIVNFNPLDGDWDDEWCEKAMDVARALLASAEGSALTPREERKVDLVERIATAICNADPTAPSPDAPIYIGTKPAKAWEGRLPMARAALAAITAAGYRLEKVEDWDGRSIGESNPLSGACDIALQDALCQVDDRGERIWSYDDAKLQKSLAAQGYAISAIKTSSKDRGEATPSPSLSGRE